MSQIDEIKAKIDIVDLVSEYIPLKQAGVNWKACCPFHNEKTPSFMVSKERQSYHCFGCSEGGDIFSFVQKIEGVDFPEALKYLADKAGVKLERVDPKLVSQKTKYLEICDLAAKYYHQILIQSQNAKGAREYLVRRKLNDTTIKNFLIGYAPEGWTILYDFLKKRKFADADILGAGLIIKREGRSGFYDRFRGRVIFPIWDINGAVVGFTARLLNENQPNAGGKYINSPQTLIYNKSNIIYCLDKAKKAIKEKDLAVVVEGQMDAIASHQAGVKNVIASSGTAFTLTQIKLIQRYTNNLAVSFDMDVAGQAAAERGIDLALSMGMNIKVVVLPPEYNGQKIKDPDDCIKVSPELWVKTIDSAMPIMDYYFDKVFVGADLNKPDIRKKAALKYLTQLTKMPDLIEQNFYLQKLSAKIDVPENLLRETMYKIENKKKITISTNMPNKVAFAPDRKSREYLLSQRLLSAAIKFPENLPYIINHFNLELVVDKELADFYKELILYYNKDKIFNYSEFEKILLQQEGKKVNLLTTLSLLADKDFLDFSSQQVEKEIIDIIANLQKSYLFRKMADLQHQLVEAEKNEDQPKIKSLINEISNLTQNLNSLI